MQKNGQALREGEETLPKELARLGYETGFVGKLHLGADGNGAVPEKYWAGHGHFFGYQCYNGFRDQVCFYDEQGTEHQFYEHRTDVTARLGIERIAELARSGKPFLQTIFFQAPHYPEQPSEQYERLYDGVEFPMPEQYGQIAVSYTHLDVYKRQEFSVSENAVVFLRKSAEEVFSCVPKVRPRHLFFQEDIPGILKKRAAETETLKRNIAAACARTLPRPPLFYSFEGEPEYREYFGEYREYCDRDLVACALGHALLGDGKAAQKAKELLLTICSWNPDGPCAVNAPWNDEIGLSNARDNAL